MTDFDDLKIVVYVMRASARPLFHIHIHGSENVLDLRAAIKQEMAADDLEGIAWYQLQLHKVRLRVDGVDDKHLEQKICEEVERAKSTGDFELLDRPLRRLDTYFTRAYWQSVVGGMVHLLVIPPSKDDASVPIEESHQLPETSRSSKRPRSLEGDFDQSPRRLGTYFTRAYWQSVVGGMVHLLVTPPSKPDASVQIEKSHQLPETSRSSKRLRTLAEDTTTKPIPPYLFEYHEQFWGKPLPPTWTNLVSYPEMEVDNTENKSESEDEDEDEDEDEVVLETNVITETFEPIFIRAEYLRAFQAVLSLYESDDFRRLIVILTGQSGIGKTVWITYALLRCLSMKQPVIWYRHDTYIYFTESGLSTIEPVTHRSGGKYTWCLVDSVDAPSTLPTTMTHQGIELFPIYVTSPKESRWRSLPQQRPTNILIMNPWALNELEAAAKRLPNVNGLSKARERFEMAGPTARLCLTDKDEEVAEFVSKRQAAISNLVRKEKILELLNDGTNLQLDTWPHRICLVRRLKVAEFNGRYYIKPMTRTVEQLLLRAFFKLQKQEIVQLYQMFNPIEAAHGMTGTIFEAYCQKMLSDGITLMTAPMFRRSNTRWHSMYGDWTSKPTLVTPQREAQEGSSPIMIPVYPSQYVYYETAEKVTIEENKYYIPLRANEVGIDSLIVLGQNLYLFQFTVGKEHGIKAGLRKSLRDFTGLPPPSNRYFIFVIPERDRQLECPATNLDFLGDRPPYTAWCAEETDSISSLSHFK